MNQNSNLHDAMLTFRHLKWKYVRFICKCNTYWQRKSKWMEEQSEIDGTLLNPVSLTDLIKAQTKETTKRKKG